MRTNIGNVPLEKELLKERNWSKHLEYTENLWRKDIQGLNISNRYLEPSIIRLIPKNFHFKALIVIFEEKIIKMITWMNFLVIIFAIAPRK